jgi:hypothetical protein
LTHLPTYALLSSFYAIRPTTTLASFLITLVSTALPFALLRQPSPVHTPSTAPDGTISNRGILTDRATTIYTSLAAGSVYAVILSASFATWLPVYLVTHFDSIPDIRTTHSGPAGLPVLLLCLLLAGYAVRDFIFAASTGLSRLDEAHRPPGPVTGKFKVLVSRTVFLATMICLNTVVQVAGTIRGVDVQGAVGWGGIWTVATLIIGLVFGWIVGVDGV